MPDKSIKDEDKFPDRLLECSECRKPIAVRYTEVVGESITEISMCNDCPELRRRLQGAPQIPHLGNTEDGGTGLACGECGTSLESLRKGNLMGCSNCYEVFGDVLISELLEINKIPERIAINKKTTPIHLGRAPGEIQEMNPSMRLLALNEALNDTLKREDYEQAAWLRDQIKALTEKPEKPNEPEK
jgi:protein arginine kinase activator